MKILLLGKNGQVGWELSRSLSSLGEVVALDRSGADLSHPDSLRGVLQEACPDIIVNAAAYTAVDKAEEEEVLASAINSIAPGVLAEETSKLGALLVHYSTDYVFDGSKDGPYVETDMPNPLNVYGKTKLSGEKLIQASGCDYMIFRTSWVYSPRGHNFLLTILRLAEDRDQLSIVSDQFGSPTSARLIAELSTACLSQAISARHSGSFTSGLYHMVSSGYTSWYGFAKAVISSLGEKRGLRLKADGIKAIESIDYPTPAKRPLNSRMSTDKIQEKFGISIPDWQSELDICLQQL